MAQREGKQNEVGPLPAPAYCPEGLRDLHAVRGNPEEPGSLSHLEAVSSQGGLKLQCRLPNESSQISRDSLEIPDKMQKEMKRSTL